MLATENKENQDFKRIHISPKSNGQLLKYLEENRRTFHIERSMMGNSTYFIGDKKVYVREKQVSKKFLGKISAFQNQVSKSSLFAIFSESTAPRLSSESERIRRTILYKSFNFYPAERNFKGIIKLDINSAYWQTCRIMKVIEDDLYKDVVQNVVKGSRLKITGTLGRKIHIVDYVEGEKKDTYLKQESKKRIVFKYIYERVKKLVDEIMVMAYQHNPENYIGFYVDGLWLREYDDELIRKMKSLYDLSVKVVDATLVQNTHGKYSFVENFDGEITPYDVQFRKFEMSNYVFLHDLTDLKVINFTNRV